MKGPRRTWQLAVEQGYADRPPSVTDEEWMIALRHLRDGEPKRRIATDLGIPIGRVNVFVVRVEAKIHRQRETIACPHCGGTGRNGGR